MPGFNVEAAGVGQLHTATPRSETIAEASSVQRPSKSAAEAFHDTGSPFNFLLQEGLSKGFCTDTFVDQVLFTPFLFG